MYHLWDALEKAKNLRWIELSHPLDNDSPYWSGIPEGSVELSKTVYDWGMPQLDTLTFPDTLLKMLHSLKRMA